MQILDGKALSKELLDDIKNEVDGLNKKPHLAVILVGNDEASKVYVNIKKKTCEKLGITSSVINFDENISEKVLIEKIEELNNDSDVNAILVQFPLPKQINYTNCVNKILPIKDVDGFTAINKGMIAMGEKPLAYPCTPLGIMSLLEKYNINLYGLNAVVIGRSNIVGKPLADMLLQKNATVTVCHSHTKNLSDITKTADILISAVGRKIVTPEMLKQDAIVIDVGIVRTDEGKITGDVYFEQVKDKVSFITPVPGGVGPMTIASLMQNTLSLYKQQN